MKLTRLLTPAAVTLAITLATMPALAQSGGNEGQRRSRDRGARATESGDQNPKSGRDVAVRRSAPREESRGGDGTEARNRPTDNRASSSRQNDNRGYDARRNDNRGNNARQNENRGYDARRNDNRGYDARRDNSWQYSNRDYRWRGSYDRNAWRSRIRFGLGISIFSGRPFSFRFDYGWRPGFNYRYPMRPGVAYGGMSFLLNPDDAEVYIDGAFVGIARDFGGQPVPVAVGFHRLPGQGLRRPESVSNRALSQVTSRSASAGVIQAFNLTMSVF